MHVVLLTGNAACVGIITLACNILCYSRCANTVPLAISQNASNSLLNAIANSAIEFILLNMFFIARE